MIQILKEMVDGGELEEMPPINVINFDEFFSEHFMEFL